MNYLGSLDEISNYRFNRPDTSLVIDTNVLLLLLIGIHDETTIAKCSLMTNNGKNYREKEFKLLTEIIKRFSNKVIITPETLSEIYSLSHKHIKDCFYIYLAKAIETLKTYDEKHIPFSVILKNQAVLQFGFTDISIVEIAKITGATILTDEFDMYELCCAIKIPIIKFEHVIASEIYKI